MRFGILLLTGLLLILEQIPVFAQAETDTLGLTGTMAYTVVARRLFAEMKEVKGIILFASLKITSAYLVILTGKY